MNIKCKIENGLGQKKEYTFTIPELFDFALEDPGGDEATTALNNSRALGKLCEVMADKLQLSAPEILEITGLSATDPEFC